jgi:hypothetical protein
MTGGRAVGRWEDFSDRTEKLCNTGIGNLRDNPKLLRAAADYLER